MIYTVPWAPSLAGRQLGHIEYVALRTTAIIWQLGIAKGFERETVKQRLAAPDATRDQLLALELGMLEPECAALAAEFWP